VAALSQQGDAVKRLLFFAAILSLVLAACGGGGEPTGKSAASGPVHITFWHSEVASSNDNLVKLVDRFNASQDEAKVEPIYQGTDQDLTLKLIASMPSGNVPAIAYMSEPYTQSMIDSGQITPIQEYLDQGDYDLSDFAPAAIAYYTVNDTLYAMPYGLAVPLMYYDRAPFREVGLDPDRPPRDLDEAQAASEKLLQRDSGGNITRSGFALDVSPWYLEVMLAGAGELYVNNDNGRAGFATAVAFDNEAGRKFFQWWHDMAEKGLLLNTGRGPSAHVDALMAIPSKRGVMALSISGALRSIVDVLAKGGAQGVEPGGVAPVPGIPGRVPEGSPGVYSRSLWIMSGRPQPEQDAAWKFIKWLVEPEQQAEWFAGSGYLPVRNSAYDLPASKDIIAQYPEFQIPVDLFAKTATTTAALGPLLGPFQQVRAAVAEAIESMLSGAATPDEAMEMAVKNGNAAIEDYNRRMGR
jgi:sn-glycerol 3-phosphate transport system substrate-binding protein